MMANKNKIMHHNRRSGVNNCCVASTLVLQLIQLCACLTFLSLIPHCGVLVVQAVTTNTCVDFDCAAAPLPPPKQDEFPAVGNERSNDGKQQLLVPFKPYVPLPHASEIPCTLASSSSTSTSTSTSSTTTSSPSSDPVLVILGPATLPLCSTSRCCYLQGLCAISFPVCPALMRRSLELKYCEGPFCLLEECCLRATPMSTCDDFNCPTRDADTGLPLYNVGREGVCPIMTGCFQTFCCLTKRITCADFPCLEGVLRSNPQDVICEGVNILVPHRIITFPFTKEEAAACEAVDCCRDPCDAVLLETCAEKHHLPCQYGDSKCRRCFDDYVFVPQAQLSLVGHFASEGEEFGPERGVCLQRPVCSDYTCKVDGLTAIQHAETVLCRGHMPPVGASLLPSGVDSAAVLAHFVCSENDCCRPVLGGAAYLEQSLAQDAEMKRKAEEEAAKQHSAAVWLLVGILVFVGLLLVFLSYALFRYILKRSQLLRLLRQTQAAAKHRRGKAALKPFMKPAGTTRGKRAVTAQPGAKRKAAEASGKGKIVGKDKAASVSAVTLISSSHVAAPAAVVEAETEAETKAVQDGDQDKITRMVVEDMEEGEEEEDGRQRHESCVSEANLRIYRPSSARKEGNEGKGRLLPLADWKPTVALLKENFYLIKESLIGLDPIDGVNDEEGFEMKPLGPKLDFPEDEDMDIDMDIEGNADPGNNVFFQHERPLSISVTSSAASSRAATTTRTTTAFPLEEKNDGE